MRTLTQLLLHLRHAGRHGQALLLALCHPLHHGLHPQILGYAIIHLRRDLHPELCCLLGHAVAPETILRLWDMVLIKRWPTCCTVQLTWPATLCRAAPVKEERSLRSSGSIALHDHARLHASSMSASAQIAFTGRHAMA